MTEMYEEKNAIHPDSAKTFGFLASPLARSYNRHISGFVPSTLRPNSPFGRTSDMRRPLSEIGIKRFRIIKKTRPEQNNRFLRDKNESPEGIIVQYIQDEIGYNNSYVFDVPIRSIRM